jgi:hypothetical protein
MRRPTLSRSIARSQVQPDRRTQALYASLGEHNGRLH